MLALCLSVWVQFRSQYWQLTSSLSVLLSMIWFPTWLSSSRQSKMLLFVNNWKQKCLRLGESELWNDIGWLFPSFIATCTIHTQTYRVAPTPRSSLIYNYSFFFFTLAKSEWILSPFILACFSNSHFHCPCESEHFNRGTNKTMTMWIIARSLATRIEWDEEPEECW